MHDLLRGKRTTNSFIIWSNRSHSWLNVLANTITLCWHCWCLQKIIKTCVYSCAGHTVRQLLNNTELSLFFKMLMRITHWWQFITGSSNVKE